MSLKVRFDRPTNSKHWSDLENRFPGIKEVLKDIKMILKLTGFEDVEFTRTKDRKGTKKFTFEKGTFDQLLRIYLYENETAKVREFSLECKEKTITTTKELEEFLRDWVVNL